MQFPLLLADVQDFIKVIIPLAALVIWILSQVFGQKGGKPDAPPAGNPRPQPDQGGLRQEIERFLREAQKQAEQQNRDQNQTQRREAASATPEAAKQERQRRKREEKQRNQARQRAKELAAGSQRKPEPMVVEDVEIVSPQTSVAQHVSAYMDSSKFRESASHLGEQVGLADERLASHLQEVFSHSVSSFGDGPVEAERKGAAAARSVVGGAQIAAMLRDPNMFRHAIVMNEIFNRPEDRWE